MMQHLGTGRRAGRAALLLAIVLLAGCAKSVIAPEEAVQAAAYRAPGPDTLTLFTMVNNRSGGGGHSALMINGPAERVIFDPAGTWWHRTAPERNDVIHGITPTMLDFYIGYHARETYRVEMHTIEVSPEVAARARAAAVANGAVPNAMCARATSAVLRQTPGFEDIPSTLFPITLMEAFAARPGVRHQTIREEDGAENRAVLAAQQASAAPAPAEAAQPSR